MEEKLKLTFLDERHSASALLGAAPQSDAYVDALANYELLAPAFADTVKNPLWDNLRALLKYLYMPRKIERTDGTQVVSSHGLGNPMIAFGGDEIEIEIQTIIGKEKYRVTADEVYRIIVKGEDLKA